MKAGFLSPDRVIFTRMSVYDRFCIVSRGLRAATDYTLGLRISYTYLPSPVLGQDLVPDFRPGVPAVLAYPNLA